MSLHKRRKRVKKTERGSTPPQQTQSETRSLRVDAERRISSEKREVKKTAKLKELRRGVHHAEDEILEAEQDVWSYGCFQTRGETAEDKMLVSETDRRTEEDRRTKDRRTRRRTEEDSSCVIRQFQDEAAQPTTN